MNGSRAALALVLPLAILLTLPREAPSQETPGQETAGQDTPFLAGYVMDEAGLLSPDVEERLNVRLQAFAESTGSQVVVLTVPDLGGLPIEDFSIERAEEWGLGRGEEDDGVLVVIAQAERRMRIEVGYGLEGALTDAASRRILDNVMGPRFRDGDFDGGVEAGVERIMATVRGEVPPPDEVDPTAPEAPSFLWRFISTAVFIILFMMVLAAMRRRARGSRGWSSRTGWRPGLGPVILPFPLGRPGRGGGARGGDTIRLPGGWGGGGFGGFRGGGGGFGGGGASGSW